MNLYVIRHGETEWNKLFVLQGATDIPLNENGIKQAKEASNKFKDIHFKSISSVEIFVKLFLTDVLMIYNILYWYQVYNLVI